MEESWIKDEGFRGFVLIYLIGGVLGMVGLYIMSRMDAGRNKEQPAKTKVFITGDSTSINIRYDGKASDFEINMPALREKGYTVKLNGYELK